METLYNYVHPFFGWLLHSTFQASIIVCLILLIQALLRNRLTARWHYALWLILVVRMVLPWTPQSRFSIYNFTTWEHKSNVPVTITSERDAEPTKTPGGSSVVPQTIMGPEPAEVSREHDRSLPFPTGTSRASTDSATNTMFRLSGILLLFWLAGALLLGSYIIICNLRLWRAARIECPSTDKETLDLLEECRATIGLRTIVALIPTETTQTPVLLGFVRPRLLVPKGIAEKLNRKELRYVFLHELAHVKRNDIAIGWLTALLQVVHWFNPFVWMAFHRMRSNRESACDALVLSCMKNEETQGYGRAIVSLLEHFSVPQSLPGLAGILESKSQLKRRIAMITQFKNNSYHWSPLAVILIIAIGCTSLSDMRRNTQSDATVAASGPATTLKKILPEDGDFANVSPDGKYLCDADPDTGNLAIRELATGKRWPVTGKKTWEESDEWAEEAAISPDSRRVAYLWWNDASDLASLYVVNLDGSGRKLLCKDTYAIPRDWSADGSKILAILDGLPYRMVWVSASDGSIQQIKDIGMEYPGKFDVSPNGRFVAYDLPQAEGTKERDVFLFDPRDNREVRLAEHPANDRLLGWTPNGKWILFASDRSGKWDAWLLGINDGVPSGPPRMVKANIGDIGAVGFASNGDYYFSIYDLRSNVYVAPFDIARGTLLSPPTLMQPTGKSGGQIWSPDGQYLAYSCRVNDETSLIKIWSRASGQERELNPKLPRRLFSWAPDGKSLILSGFLDEGWYNSVYKLDLETGECSEFLRHKDMSIAFAQWLPDGKRLLYHSHHGPNPARKQLSYLMIRDMDSGEEREITRGEFFRDYQWALSPDGRQVAVKLRGDNAHVKIFSTETDEVREILTGDVAEDVFQITWTPDGSALMLRVLDFPAKHTSEIWCVAVDSGKPEKLSELDIPEYVTDMRIDPTGRQIALRAITNLHELWVMENFLPEYIDK